MTQTSNVISLDSTQSGMQIAAGLTKDINTAKMVNMVDGTGKTDLYGKIGALVKQKVEELKDTDEKFANTLEVLEMYAPVFDRNFYKKYQKASTACCLASHGKHYTRQSQAQLK